MAYKYATHTTAEFDAAADGISAHVQNTAVHMTAAEKQKLSGLENYDDTELRGIIAGKQDALTFDDLPASGSSNPVKSGGVFTALGGKIELGDVFGYGSALPDNTDFNTLITPGTYCLGNSATSSAVNAPVTVSANSHLLVLQGSANTVVQIFKVFSVGQDSHFYIRRWAVSAQVWRDWKKYTDSDTLTGSIFGLGTELTASQSSRFDFDTLITPGTYRIGLTALGYSDHAPRTDEAARIEVRYLNSENNVIQTFYPLVGSNPFYVRQGRLASTGWGDWYKFEGTVVS